MVTATKAGSKAAMRQALESVYQYMTAQQCFDRELPALRQGKGWWPMLPDTMAEVRYALGKDEPA